MHITVNFIFLINLGSIYSAFVSLDRIYPVDSTSLNITWVVDQSCFNSSIDCGTINRTILVCGVRTSHTTYLGPQNVSEFRLKSFFHQRALLADSYYHVCVITDVYYNRSTESFTSCRALKTYMAGE